MIDNAIQTELRSRRFLNTALPLLDDAYRLARFLLRNRVDAEDAVQECYLRALRHFDNYRGPAFKPWLLTILRNICYTEFARRVRQEALPEFSEIAPADCDPSWRQTQPSPEADLVRQQEGVTVRQTIAALPRLFREVIVLREIDGMSYREIAEITGTPIGTVMSRLARGRILLRASLDASGLAPRRARPSRPAIQVSEAI